MEKRQTRVIEILAPCCGAPGCKVSIKLDLSGYDLYETAQFAAHLEIANHCHLRAEFCCDFHSQFRVESGSREVKDLSPEQKVALSVKTWKSGWFWRQQRQPSSVILSNDQSALDKLDQEDPISETPQEDQTWLLDESGFQAFKQSKIARGLLFEKLPSSTPKRSDVLEIMEALFALNKQIEAELKEAKAQNESLRHELASLKAITVQQKRLKSRGCHKIKKLAHSHLLVCSNCGITLDPLRVQGFVRAPGLVRICLCCYLSSPRKYASEKGYLLVSKDNLHLSLAYHLVKFLTPMRIKPEVYQVAVALIRHQLFLPGQVVTDLSSYAAKPCLVHEHEH